MLEQKTVGSKEACNRDTIPYPSRVGTKNFSPLRSPNGLSELSGLAHPPIMSAKNDLTDTIDGTTAHPREVYAAPGSRKWPPSSSPTTFGLVVVVKSQLVEQLIASKDLCPTSHIVDRIALYHLGIYRYPIWFLRMKKTASLPIESSIRDIRILAGDSREVLPLLESESIQCCVTSPPTT